MYITKEDVDSVKMWYDFLSERNGYLTTSICNLVLEFWSYLEAYHHMNKFVCADLLYMTCPNQIPLLNSQSTQLHEEKGNVSKV